jgi:hypothetical protein
VQLARRSQRNRKRAPARDLKSTGDAPQADRYDKYLPAWMKGANGAPPPRPRVRRARQARPAGGYTPGKFAIGPGEF